MKMCVAVATLVFLAVWPNVVCADGIGDLLKQAVEDYVEDKAEKAGLTSDKDGKTEAKPQEVNFVFNGAPSANTEVFRSLHAERTTPKPSGGSQTAAEKNCFDRVQDKIAWNNSGQKRWSAHNIKALCKGTTRAAQPPSCFSRAMFSGSQWGKRPQDNMNWSLASKLCAGTNNASGQINCLKQKIAQNKSLNAAVAACSGSAKPLIATPVVIQSPVVVANLVNFEQQCYNNIQGKVSWVRGKSTKNWGAANVKRLCKGTRSATAPRSCFNYIFHYPQKWRKSPSQTIGWSGAIDVCEGTSDSNKTINCFKSAISHGASVSGAIKRCEKVGVSK